MRLDAVRSLLFAPGWDERKLRRTLESGADAAVWDLEDAVPPARKPAARALVGRLLAERPQASCLLLVRVNAAGSEQLAHDLAALDGAPVDGLVLPKATTAAVGELDPTGPPLIALVETAAGVRDADEIASAERVHALMLGALDLAAELGLAPLPGGAELLAVRSRLVLASAAAGIRAPIDSPYPRLDDAAGLAAECRLVRALGFRGKACIHPAQVVVVHEAFAPGADELKWARAVVAVGSNDETGVGRAAGQMVDAPVFERARRLLEEAERSGA